MSLALFNGGPDNHEKCVTKAKVGSYRWREWRGALKYSPGIDDGYAVHRSYVHANELCVLCDCSSCLSTCGTNSPRVSSAVDSDYNAFRLNFYDKLWSEKCNCLRYIYLYIYIIVKKRLSNEWAILNRLF